MSLNSLASNVSGQGGPAFTTNVSVVFDAPYLGYQGNAAAFANQDQVPSFMFWSGDPKPYIDAGGNVVWKSRNLDGSLPT